MKFHGVPNKIRQSDLVRLVESLGFDPHQTKVASILLKPNSVQVEVYGHTGNLDLFNIPVIRDEESTEEDPVVIIKHEHEWASVRTVEDTRKQRDPQVCTGCPAARVVVEDIDAGQ